MRAESQEYNAMELLNSNNPNEDFYGVSDSFVIGVQEGSQICEFPFRLAIFMSNEEQFDERDITDMFD